MPFQAVPNTIQCDAIFNLFGQRVENVFHVEVPGGVDAPTIGDTANQVRDWVEDSYLPLLSHNIVFLGVDAKNLSIEEGGTAFAAPTGDATGGSGDDSMPGGTAFVVSLRTAESGRSFRGRKYVMGLARSQIVSNAVLSGYANDLVAAFNDLIAVLVAVDKVLVIVSRIADGIERITALTTPVTVATAVDLNVDSQRRRLNGRGS